MVVRECEGGQKNRSCASRVARGNTADRQLIPINQWCQDESTFAINSLFLNSPLTRVTLPFSSNSVHRNFNSLVGLMILPARPVLSSKKPGSSFGDGEALLCGLG